MIKIKGTRTYVCDGCKSMFESDFELESVNPEETFTLYELCVEPIDSKDWSYRGHITYCPTCRANHTTGDEYDDLPF